MRTHNFIAAGIVASAALLLAGAASAHAHLVKSTPAANATVVTPKARLMPGIYKINWHAASSDGHRMDGVVDFTVK